MGSIEDQPSKLDKMTAGGMDELDIATHLLEPLRRAW